MEITLWLLFGGLVAVVALLVLRTSTYRKVGRVGRPGEAELDDVPKGDAAELDEAQAAVTQATGTTIGTDARDNGPPAKDGAADEVGPSGGDEAPQVVLDTDGYGMSNVAGPAFAADPGHAVSDGHDRGHGLRPRPTPYPASPPPAADDDGSRADSTGGTRKEVSLDEAVRRALGVDVRMGALGIDAPPLRLGRNDLVRVVISRDTSAQSVVTRFVASSQVPDVGTLRTSAFMHVDLTGPTFDIRRLNPPDGEQLVADTAVWEFDVLPRASGLQRLTVSALMRIPVPGHGERAVTVPSLEMKIRVDVDRIYAGRSFVRRNWQWVGTSVVAVAAIVARLVWP